MDFTCSLSDLIKYLCGLASTPLGYIHNLKDNVDLLQKETGDLNARREDVEARVKRAERGGGVQRTSAVKNWLDNVQNFLSEADRVIRKAKEHDRIKCLGHCLPQNCWSGYQLGKTVHRMLDEARELKKEELNTTLPLPPPQVVAMPMNETVGPDISFNKVWKWLVDEKEIGVIGLYGTGGVGKTTLMKRINNNLMGANHVFEVVIWVVVSRQVKEDNIQDIIRKRLDIEDEIWKQWSQDERVHHLLKYLTQKKFVLLIDDVWAKLDLSKIGVPRSCLGKKSKVVFTTRLEEVCYQMKADKTCQVQCLTPKEALELFENNVGKSTVHSHPEIPELAKNVALECKGLPLALITVGQAMAGKANPGEWRHALTTLRNRPHRLPRMEEDVYHILKFSYDGLGNATQQACFLYCCCFPEDYSIRTNELIELWIGEGLLGDTNDAYYLRDKGTSILGNLKRACLLESGLHSYGKPTVKMHDVIRDMATWITRDQGQRENKLLVIENEKDMSMEMISKWGEAEIVSLWGSLIANINLTPPTCSQLKTLFVRETKVSRVPRGFFESMMACLTVLDLSVNENIESFPEEICNLISLQYLNLSSTKIRELPKEIKNLTRLRWLIFDSIKLLMTVLIPTGTIASLPLNVFNMWGMELIKNEEEVVEELGDMQDLIDLSIKVRKSFSARKIFQYLQRCIRKVMIQHCKDLTYIPTSCSLEGRGNFLHLELLCLYGCPMLAKMEITQGIGQAPNCSCFPSLVEVRVGGCGFLDLSWLVHAPKLRELVVGECPSMKKIIGDGFAREEVAALRLFSRLNGLCLYSLPNLKSICDHTLSFPQDVDFRINGCPNVRKLPLDSNSARGSFSIYGDRDWWNKFEWDPAARVAVEFIDQSPVEEMTLGEALGKIRVSAATIRFLPSRAE